MLPPNCSAQLCRTLLVLTGLFAIGSCNHSTPAQQQAGTFSPMTDSTQTSTTATLPTITAFGKTTDGAAVQIYTLTNAHGMKVSITNYGGIITSLVVPDKDGKLGDVVLGFDEISGYQSPAYRKAGPYFGALIGRYANRIAQGKFTLDGREYTLAQNNDGNTLHGGNKGFDKVIWQAVPGASAVGQTLTLTYLSKDGEEGYPGNLTVKVVYTLTVDNALQIDYSASTDKATPVNLTNHTYFNLNAGPDVLAHEITIDADRYNVVDAGMIPTGELRPVKGTPFDFTAPHTIGERIGQVPNGYDHNWLLRKSIGQPAATVYEPTTGRTMQVATTEPGVQFYTGNFLDGTLRGKNGQVYGKHAGFCLETQHFPDSPNQPNFPTTILKPGQTLHSTTTYTFGVRK
ncbi:galactose mutarotase [Hymenobacter sediminicola]|uniref:Aldose 1-epimerase n=2 Tax=Hymenobacter sediminicola TaxID=2761579 RepID=A0A7G7WAZ4_9BACT|nr:galactose mutarotase [Hymenobacter sediminicola]